MAESEKPDSSTRKAKAKTTLIDDDISKDFLSSWKSMSVVGGNDMDFNFEPVAKGNKKAFDFGMDMDFSLDDAFGKMPSFKLDMPDIDFSSSSKTSSISKENKSEEESNKESRPEKNDKFTFSFDFNRFDGFQFDEPATKGGKNATGDKNSKQASSSYKIVCEDMPKQAASDSEARKEDAMHKELPKSEVAVSSKPGFLVEQERSLDVDQQKGTQISRDKTITVDALEPGPESRLKVETSSKISCAHARAHDFNSIPESNLLHMLVDSEEAYVSPETNKIMTAEGIEEDIHVTEKTSKQVFNEVKEQVQSTAVSMVKVSTQAISSDEEEVCSRNGKLVDGSSEQETLREEFAANALLSADSKTLNSHRLSPPSLIEKMIISEEEKVVGAVVRLGNDNSTLDTVACSAINISQTLNSEVELNIELQKSGLKDTPAPSDSEPTPAKSILTLHKLSGANNFIKVHGINNGAGTKPLMLERSKKVSTPLKAVDSGERNGEKLGDNPSSCAKELMKQDLAAEKREKNPDALWDGDSNENEDIQTNMVVDAEPRDGQAKKGGFRLLDNRKISIEVKPSGIQLPSLPGPERGAKSSNQGYWKIKDKISSIATVRKSNVGQVNRLSSARIDKLAPSLPSLRISRNITTNKQSSSSLVQDPKSMGNFEKSAMLQVKSKMASPVNFRKQSPSISSLKRKPTEATDLHSSKRLSPSENSMSKVSVREVENEVQTQRTLLGGSKKNVTDENLSPEFDFRLEANMENLDFTLMVESDANVEKAEVCAKELDDICSMLKKKHDEAKELLVRALVNNNNLLMLNHPICEEKIRRVQEFSSRLMSKEQEAGV